MNFKINVNRGDGQRDSVQSFCIKSHIPNFHWIKTIGLTFPGHFPRSRVIRIHQTIKNLRLHVSGF